MQVAFLTALKGIYKININFTIDSPNNIYISITYEKLFKDTNIRTELC